MDGLRVLLVLFDRILHRRLEEQLRARGDEIVSVATPDQALAKLAVESFDLLVVEGQPGNTRALELARRARVSLPNMATILLTSEVTRENMLQAVRAHVFDVIHLPLEQMDLLTMSLDRAAERVRLVRERDHLLESLRRRNDELEISLARLNEAYERLMSQEEALEADLRRAQLMQQNLLPESFPLMSGMEFFGYYSPSERLGGDFFGYLPLGSDKLAVYLADVSGHGVRAAMVTVIVRELLHGQLLQHPHDSVLSEPARALQLLNRGLLEETFDSPVHATLVYAVVDCARGEISYCRAGHPAPIACLGDGRLIRLQSGGPGIGLEPSPTFRSQTLALTPGSTCLFFSDGVTQAMGSHDEDSAAMALGRTLRSVRENNAQRIAERIERFALGPKGKEWNDDISFLILHRQSLRGRRPPDMPSVKIAAAHSTDHALPVPASRVEMGWQDGICMIRLVGEMSWQLGGAFQEVVEEAQEAQALATYVDLSECDSLDSTMLGLMNAYGGRLAISAPRERVGRQLVELGVAKRLRVTEEPLPEVHTLVRLTPEMNREQRAHMMLEAHESLLNLSEDNRQRFEGVVDSLRKRKAGQ